MRRDEEISPTAGTLFSQPEFFRVSVCVCELVFVAVQLMSEFTAPTYTDPQIGAPCTWQQSRLYNDPANNDGFLQCVATSAA